MTRLFVRVSVFTQRAGLGVHLLLVFPGLPFYRARGALTKEGRAGITLTLTGKDV
jgi:hypothetical protein